MRPNLLGAPCAKSQLCDQGGTAFPFGLFGMICFVKENKAQKLLVGIALGLTPDEKTFFAHVIYSLEILGQLIFAEVLVY